MSYDWISVEQAQKLFFVTPEELRQLHAEGKIERTPLRELADGRIEHGYSLAHLIREGIDARPDTSVSRWILGTGKAVVSDVRSHLVISFLGLCYAAYQKGLQEGDEETPQNQTPAMPARERFFCIVGVGEFLEESSMSIEDLAHLLAQKTKLSVSITSRALEGAPLLEERSDIIMRTLRMLEDRRGGGNFVYQMQAAHKGST